MSPFQILHGFEPDLPNPLSTKAEFNTLEDYKEVLINDPDSILTFFKTLHE